MIDTPFNPQRELIFIKAMVWSDSRNASCVLALDTGASETFVSPGILDALGYSVRDAVGLSSVTSVVGREVGYRLPVKRFEALGFAFKDFLLNAHDFHDGSGIDGLLGLSFLQNFNYEIRSKEGILRVSPI